MADNGLEELLRQRAAWNSQRPITDRLTILKAFLRDVPVNPTAMRLIDELAAIGETVEAGLLAPSPTAELTVPAPNGCVCPSTAEQTCEAFMCPRRGWVGPLDCSGVLAPPPPPPEPPERRPIIDLGDQR